jgi:hypothetical protein
MLQLITIPSLVTSLGEECFCGCASLDSISFASDSKLRQLGPLAFLLCEALASITLPASLECIGPKCFQSCLGLVSVNFPHDSRLRRIDSCAFSKCPSLRSIVIPSSVEYVGHACFLDSDSLCHLVFSSPAHVRELLDMPRELKGLQDIPDSVQSLTVRIRHVANRDQLPCDSALLFGPESQLKCVEVPYPSSVRVAGFFLQFASHMLKVFRASMEFAS